jgi:flagellar basal body-associated protein FliL
MSQEEGEKNDTMFWVVIIVLLVLVVVGGAYVRWNFWTG